MPRWAPTVKHLCKRRNNCANPATWQLFAVNSTAVRLCPLWQNNMGNRGDSDNLLIFPNRQINADSLGSSQKDAVCPVVQLLPSQYLKPYQSNMWQGLSFSPPPNCEKRSSRLTVTSRDDERQTQALFDKLFCSSLLSGVTCHQNQTQPTRLLA